MGGRVVAKVSVVFILPKMTVLALKWYITKIAPKNTFHPKSLKIGPIYPFCSHVKAGFNRYWEDLRT